MSFQLIDTGGSRSFPEGLSSEADCTVILGSDPVKVAGALAKLKGARPILVELGTECLAFHVGEAKPDNVVGFARFRMGDAPPTQVVEVVQLPNTRPDIVSFSKDLFEKQGCEVCVCADFPGRMIDALMRPYFNSALAAIDEGIADAATLDLAIRMGLGYPKGPIELLEATGIAAHGEVSMALHEALGEGFLPARRAYNAARRKRAGLGD